MEFIVGLCIGVIIVGIGVLLLNFNSRIRRLEIFISQIRIMPAPPKSPTEKEKK